MPTANLRRNSPVASLICCLGATDAWSGRSICNLLELDLQMPGQGWKHLQLVGIGFADAYYQVDIKNPTTIEVDCFLCRKRAKCSCR